MTSASSQIRQHRDRLLRLAFPTGLLLITLVAYIPALSNGFTWDDDEWVTENPALRDLSGLRRIWLEPSAQIQYYPVCFTSWWIDYQLWGRNPLAYHLENILLHGLSAALLWLILRKLGVPGAWLAAAIFALHPVHVESVAWITERKNTLSGFFYLASLLAYLRFAQLDAPATHRRWGLYALSLFLFLLALLSKTVASTLPAALLLLLWWKRDRLRLADILPLIPLFVLGLSLGLTTAYIEKHQVGAAGREWSLSFVEQCLLAGRAVWFYLGKLIWPARLTFVYPRWQIDAGQWWQYLYPAAAIALVIVLWLARRRIGRGPLGAALFFGGTLLPALGFFNVYYMRYSFVADHFQYVASLGPIALLAAGLTLLLRRLRTEPTSDRVTRPARLATRAAIAAPGLLILFILGASTWNQSKIYRDKESLWRHTLAVHPEAWIAHNNLGRLLVDRGEYDQAIGHLNQALQQRPNDPEPHINLGSALAGKGRLDEAIASYRRALDMVPEYYRVHNNLGLALAKQGRFQEAILHYEKALLAGQEQSAIRANLARALVESGRFEEAVTQYREVVSQNPHLPNEQVYLGVALTGLGRLTEAIEHLEAAVKLDPASEAGHYRLGLALTRQQKYEQAMQHLQMALRLNPRHARAHNACANVLLAVGQRREAYAHYRQALTIDPNYAEAHHDLGLFYLKTGHMDQAGRHFRRALEIQPYYAEAHNGLAGVLASKGEFQEALAHSEAAVTLKHDYLDGLRNLSLLHARLGNTDAAYTACSRAVELAPNDAQLRYLLADVLLRQGKTEAAKEQYRQLLRIDPTNERAKEALNAIR